MNAVRAVWSIFALCPAVAGAQPLLPGLSSSQEQRQADCLIEHIRRTDSDAARSYINRACNFMSLPTADWNLNREERDFHTCILDVLPGTDDDRNAVQLANACRARAWAK
ncbi:MAG: hypothetical protein KDE14_05800 [Rhodobacteraceae bacterium]|nr:hypothetical protein [Paracoccaceae bacterium]